MTLLIHQNTGKEIAMENIFLLYASEKIVLLYLSVHWGDLIEQIKKICHIHFKAEAQFFTRLIFVFNSGCTCKSLFTLRVALLL